MAFRPVQRQYPAYGYCESFFVEGNDEGVYARAAAERESVRQINKIKQKALGEELSRATAEEYQEDVLDHMEHMEAETMPDIHSIEIQTEIQWFMRPYLLDFLLEAHHAFQLLPETLHLAVNLLDRYCSRRVVYKRHYQLVGCAALLIAAKYGDRKERVPTIRELKSMCCSLYDDDMFTQMEWHVLQTLNWMVGHPTVTSFQQLAMSEVSCDPELEHMSWYLTEIALYHKEFISIRPSVMARSALALARCITGRQQPRYSEWAARYDPQVVLNLSNYLAQPSAALVRKYSSPHLSAVATTIEQFLQRQALLAQQAATPEIHVQQVASPVDSHFMGPQTPQKACYMQQAPTGVLTPPITPDKDYNNADSYGMPQSHNTRMGACTPTPPSSVEHYQQQQQHMGYQQQQYVQHSQYAQ